MHVTHDQEEAIALGTRVAVMNAGRIEQIDEPVAVYRAPATEYVADFLGARNRLELDADAGTVEGTPVPGLVAPGLSGRHVVRLRDEHLAVRPATADGGRDATTAWLTGGRVVEILPGVGSSEIVVELGERRVFVRTPTDAGAHTAAVHPGDPVEVGFALERARCYPAAGGRLVTDWLDTSDRVVVLSGGAS